jgi:hypothetical protein
MKVCYLIQSHKNPQQVNRLVRTIKTASPGAIVAVNHDYTCSSLDEETLSQFPDVYLLKDTRGRTWAHFSVLNPYFETIQWLFENNIHFDWLVYLSGQDYPTQPLDWIERFLATTKYDGFITYAEALSERGYEMVANPEERYFYQYYWPPRRIQPFLKAFPYKVLMRIQQYLPIKGWYIDGLPIGRKAKVTPFNQDFVCYAAYMWNTLSRQCVRYIFDFMEDSNNEHIINYYKHTVIPDESFIATILLNNRQLNICNDNKRYIEFLPRDPHPRVLTEADFPTLTNGRYHFARKFEPDSRILDLLDNHILNVSV